MSKRNANSPAEKHLLPLLRDVAHASTMSLEDWDVTIRLARKAKLLGLIAWRVNERLPLWEQLPKQVCGHLRSAINFSNQRTQAVRFELDAINKALPDHLKVIALKGAAYTLENREFSRGRLPNDVDLLVSASNLKETEEALLAGGWETQVVDAYDQNYYRNWSHELPPMRYPGHALEVDLHHTITPPTSRVRANTEILFKDMKPIANSRYFALHPHDQIIHASIHLFQDSELMGRLRDIVDLDAMIRASAIDPVGGNELLMRAKHHGAERHLWYAMYFCHKWLNTPVPVETEASQPSRLTRTLMDAIFSTGSLPAIQNEKTNPTLVAASIIGSLRYHWLRMPQKMLARHLGHKCLQGFSRRLS